MADETVAKKDVKDELLVEEYKSCRDLITKNIEMIEKNEIYVIGACAAVFTFSIDKGSGLLSATSAWLPTTLSLLGLLRYWGFDMTIGKIDTYMETVESKYKTINYTTHYRKNKPRGRLKGARYAVWAALFLVSVAFGSYKTIEAIYAPESVREVVTKAFHAMTNRPADIGTGGQR